MDLIPTSMPSAPSVAPRLYDLRAIEIATAFGSLLAGALLMSRDLLALGERNRARKVLIVGFVALAPLVLLGLSYSVPERFHKLDQVMFQGAQVLLMHFIAKRQLGSAISAHREAGGPFFSRWRAAGIALLVTPVVVAVILAVAQLFPELPALR